MNSPFSKPENKGSHVRDLLELSKRKFQNGPVLDQTLTSREIQIERKTFTVALKENHRGRFVRITETSGGRYTNIVIPASGLEEFSEVISTIVRFNRRDGPNQAR
jgi:hypothetical protein